jgi:hypothetical protein
MKYFSDKFTMQHLVHKLQLLVFVEHLYFYSSTARAPESNENTIELSRQRTLPLAKFF